MTNATRMASLNKFLLSKEENQISPEQKRRMDNVMYYVDKYKNACYFNPFKSYYKYRAEANYQRADWDVNKTKPSEANKTTKIAVEIFTPSSRSIETYGWYPESLDSSFTPESSFNSDLDSVGDIYIGENI